MRVELSPFIKGDLEAIADWIAEDNPRRAVTFIREIREEFRKIGQGPLHYQLRPEIGEDERLAVVGRYVILFWIDGNKARCAQKRQAVRNSASSRVADSSRVSRREPRLRHAGGKSGMHSAQPRRPIQHC
jgi:plasmid stabilization system protein ParE